jgi:hypothetical protein
VSAVAHLSAARFAEYAAMKAPDLPPDPVQAAQVRAHRWGVQNFGCELGERYVLGLVEEYAELADAYEEDKFKELGDVLVCAAQLCTCYRLDFSTLLADAPAQPPDLAMGTMLRGIGLVARAVLKGAQKIRGMDNPAELRVTVGYGVYLVCIGARGLATAPAAAFVTRVDEIVKRDYKAHPVDGGR